VIQSFGSKETEELFHYHHSKRFRSIEAGRLAEIAPTSRCDGAAHLGFAAWKSVGSIARQSERAALDSDQ